MKWIADTFERALSEGANWEDIRLEPGLVDGVVAFWPAPAEPDNK